MFETGHGPNGALESMPEAAPSTNSVTLATCTSSATFTVMSNSAPGSNTSPSPGNVIAAVGDWVSGVDAPNVSMMCWYEFCVLPPQLHARALYSPHGASMSWKLLGPHPDRYVMGSSHRNSWSSPHACAASCPITSAMSCVLFPSVC